MSEPPPNSQALDKELLDTTFEEGDGDESDEYEFEDGNEEQSEEDDEDGEYEEDAAEGERSRSLTALLIADVSLAGTSRNSTELVSEGY
jgi:hypothetical protein